MLLFGLLSEEMGKAKGNGRSCRHYAVEKKRYTNHTALNIK